MPQPDLRRLGRAIDEYSELQMLLRSTHKCRWICNKINGLLI